MKKVVLFVVLLALMLGSISFAKGAESPSQSNNKAALKSYEEVYLEKGILACIVYFNNNYGFFTSEARQEFASRIAWEIDKRGREYSAVNYIETAPIPAPPIKLHVNSLYPGIYDGELNVLKINKLDRPIKEAVEKVAQDNLFMLTKAYCLYKLL